MAVALERQIDIVQGDPQHSRAEQGVRRQAQGLAHDRSPAVGADNARGVHGAVRPVAGIGEPLVFDPLDPRVENKVDIRLVLDGFAQPGDEHRMIACQTLGTVQIGKDDRFRAVFGKHHESLARAASRQCVDRDPDVAQDPHRGRMQPFARQPSRSLGIRFQQGHPGALPCVGKRAQAAYRARADNGYVVAPRNGAVHRKTLGWERRR